MGTAARNCRPGTAGNCGKTNCTRNCRGIAGARQLSGTCRGPATAGELPGNCWGVAGNCGKTTARSLEQQKGMPRLCREMRGNCKQKRSCGAATVVFTLFRHQTGAGPTFSASPVASSASPIRESCVFRGALYTPFNERGAGQHPQHPLPHPQRVGQQPARSVSSSSPQHPQRASQIFQ